MTRLSAPERKRLIEIMRCEREAALEDIMISLDGDANDIKNRLVPEIESIERRIDRDKYNMNALQCTLDKQLSDAKLMNHRNRYCGKMHPLIAEYELETAKLEKEILLNK